jgi:hypothetical protein
MALPEAFTWGKTSFPQLVSKNALTDYQVFGIAKYRFKSTT